MTRRRTSDHSVKTPAGGPFNPSARRRVIAGRIRLCVFGIGLTVALFLSASSPSAKSADSRDQTALASAASCTPLAGQPERTLSLVVSDLQGARVPDATVTAECGTFRQRGVTASDGTLAVRLPAGEYEVSVERAGFAVFHQRVVVSSNQDTKLAVALTLSQVSDHVTVRGSAGSVARRSTGGTKTDTLLIETPQSISVITADQIEAQVAHTLEEVVRYTAGVRAEMYGPDNRGDWFTLRGGSEGSTVLDGMRLPLSGWWGNVRNEPYAFERVEVLRGPSSVMFGQNGPGGVVNLVSKLPQADARRDVSVQFGNWQHKQVAVDLTGPVGADRRLLYRFVALAKDSGTQVNHADEERQYVAPSLTWRPNAATALTMYGQYQRDESDNTVGFFSSVGTRLPAPHGRIPDDTFIGEPEWDSYGGHRTRVGYQFERQLNATWNLRHNMRSDDVDGHVLGMYANFWEGGFLEDGRSVNRTWYATRTDTRINSADLLAQGKFVVGGTQHTVLFGVDSVWSRDVNPDLGGDATPLDVYTPVYGTFPRPELNFDPGTPTRTRQIGLIVQDQIKLDDRWVVVAGVRRDYARTEVVDSPGAGSDDAAWSRRVGVVYLARGGVAPYASYSDSFEAIAGADVYGAVYKPKRGQQLEAGVKWTPADGRYSLTAAAYDLDEKNRLTIDPDNPLNQIQRGEVSVQGVELEATANLRAWDLVANYAYTDGTVSASSDPTDPYLGKRLHSIPTHSAALWTVRRFSVKGLGRLNAGMGVRYVGETWDGTDTLATPSTALVDALFSVDRGRWRYAVNASNLFDKTYIATCLERGDCWYGNRRKVFATLSYRR